MTLTNHFNSKSQVKRQQVETETFGETTLSRYFPAIAATVKQQRAEAAAVEAEAPFLPRGPRRGMNI